MRIAKYNHPQSAAVANDSDYEALLDLTGKLETCLEANTDSASQSLEEVQCQFASFLNNSDANKLIKRFNADPNQEVAIIRIGNKTEVSTTLLFPTTKFARAPLKSLKRKWVLLSLLKADHSKQNFDADFVWGKVIQIQRPNKWLVPIDDNYELLVEVSSNPQFGGRFAGRIITVDRWMILDVQKRPDEIYERESGNDSDSEMPQKYPFLGLASTELVTKAVYVATTSFGTAIPDPQRCETADVSPYINANLDSLIGRLVKLCFNFQAPDGVIGKEHMWVRVTKVTNSAPKRIHENTHELQGVLDNIPRWVDLEYGDKIEFSRCNIEMI